MTTIFFYISILSITISLCDTCNPPFHYLKIFGSNHCGEMLFLHLLDVTLFPPSPSKQIEPQSKHIFLPKRTPYVSQSFNLGVTFEICSHKWSFFLFENPFSSCNLLNLRCLHNRQSMIPINRFRHLSHDSKPFTCHWSYNFLVWTEIIHTPDFTCNR